MVTSHGWKLEFDAVWSTCMSSASQAASANMQLSKADVSLRAAVHVMHQCLAWTLFDTASNQHHKESLGVVPVTHMPEKLYMSRATMSTRRTMAIGLEWKIICTTETQESAGESIVKRKQCCCCQANKSCMPVQ